ncbi:MAG: hypothetical protein PHC61_09615 [Chitinivibrionales bacterium]|nr:hypothetical protein [Chitinivibrionales bacterium]
MKILIPNIGSTSFKYRLIDMRDERTLAEGAIERIGSKDGPCPDYECAIEQCLKALVGPGKPLAALSELAGVGFKAVHAHNLTGCAPVDEKLLKAMEDYFFLLPAHNPPYVAAMRAFKKASPELPLFALLETDFFREMPAAAEVYAVPYEWRQNWGVQRYGFHGASHRYAGQRVGALLGATAARHISCHLGGSSSVAAIREGKAVDTSFGMTPQCGIPQNNRVGDIDVFAVLYMMKNLALSPDAMANLLGTQGGLAGISGISGDVRDLEAAAAQGNSRAQLALDAFVYSVRRYVGAFLFDLGGVDAVSFSGGIGQNAAAVRAAVLKNCRSLGIILDETANAALKGEGLISAADSKVKVLVVATNEEIIVARAVAEMIGNQN